MSASTWIARAKDRIEFHRPPRRASVRTWIGVDFSGENGPRHAKRLLPLLVFALISALGVSALRIDLIRTRYAMASAMAKERTLIEEQRNLIVRRRQLRDPVELAVKARERGFRPLSVVLTLPDPAIAGPSYATSVVTLPSVAAAPASDTTRSDWR